MIRCNGSDNIKQQLTKNCRLYQCPKPTSSSSLSNSTIGRSAAVTVKLLMSGLRAVVFVFVVLVADACVFVVFGCLFQTSCCERTLALRDRRGSSVCKRRTTRVDTSLLLHRRA